MSVTEVYHLSALVPLGVLLALQGLGYGVSGRWWLVACALAVSWVGDSASHYMGGSFAPSYVWLPAQIGLVLAAFPPAWAPAGLWAVASLAGCGLLALASAALSYPGPDGLLTLVGSVAILAVASGTPALPLWIYFWAGSLLYLTMVVEMSPEPSDLFYDVRTAYHLTRLAAYGAFGFLAIREGAWLTS